MKLKKKTWIIMAAALIVIIVVIVNLVGNKKKTTLVQAEEVTKQDIKEEVSASGYIQPKTRVNITAEVNAKIIAVPVKEGDIVSGGQLLLQLDTVQLAKEMEQSRYSYNEMEAQTEGMKSSFAQAQEEYNRQKQLFERKLTSETTYKDAEYAYLISKYNYEASVNQSNQTRAYYEKTMDNLSKTRILTPMDGVVTYLDAEVGEVAQAQTSYTQGKTLMTISNLAAFEAEVDVDETEISRIKKGQPAKIEIDAFPDSVFEGEVVEIGNTAVKSNTGTTEQSTNFKVKVLFKDANADIRSGMSATVDIMTNNRPQVLTVPYGALVMRSPDSISSGPTGKSDGVQAATDSSVSAGQKDDKKDKDIKGIFLVKQGKAVFSAVETGIADQKNIEIISGVSEKDTVITGPFRTLRTIKNNDEVKIEQQSTMEVIRK
jgi:HlyD family secretion protein